MATDKEIRIEEKRQPVGLNSPELLRVITKVVMEEEIKHFIVRQDN